MSSIIFSAPRWFCILNIIFLLNGSESANDFESSQLIVTYSAVRTVKNKGEFGIHWNLPNFQQGDTLALYNGNPMANKNLPPVWTKELQESNGFVKTGVKSSTASESNFYATITRNGLIQKISNISPKPNWMEEMRSLLENFTLPQLFIPGSHGSGNYIRPSDSVFGFKYRTLKWSQTQDLSIKQQLNYGIRYLDIRPARDEKKDTYKVNHEGIEMIPMQDVINEINEFLDETKEIVILSFKEFPRGFSSREDHEKFSAYIEKAFERHLQAYDYNQRWGMSLGSMWKTDKRLIIAYDNNSYRNAKFWPVIRQHWGDRRTIESLESFLDSLHSRSPRFPNQYTPYAAMAELTHDKTTGLKDFISLPKNSQLRRWADEVGSLIPRWYNDKWSWTTNIVAVDYFTSSGIVDLAIFWNEKRAMERYS